MPRRSESFDALAADQMKDPDFARQTLLVSIKEFDVLKKL